MKGSVRESTKIQNVPSGTTEQAAQNVAREEQSQLRSATIRYMSRCEE